MNEVFADPGAKLTRDGTHRVVAPEMTLERIAPIAPQIGVTRVAVLTGLDTIGIPVTAAIRPNSRSVAQHQGKGLTLPAAKVSALMEAIETYHAENIQLPLRLATPAEMAASEPVVDVGGLPFAQPAKSITERILWILGRDLMCDSPLWVPYELVSADFTAPLPTGSGYFQATTNGLASGNVMLEAILHGIYEVVERDASALWQAMSEGTRAARALSPASIDGPASRQLLSLFARAGVAIRSWNITSDVGLPAFAAMVAATETPAPVEPQLGFGCHVDRDVALSRALTEAAQARLTVIAGARDDIMDDGYRPSVRAARHATARSWLTPRGEQDFTHVPSCATATLHDDMQSVLLCLRSVGIRQVAWVDLTRPEFGIPVARVVIPGLEGPWTPPPDGEYTPGRRARALSPGS